MIRWSYGINQWKPQFDDFVRPRQHARALKTIAVAGFTGVELNVGTGRWEPLGNPTQLAANFGTVGGFLEHIRSIGLTSVSSWILDPFVGFREDLSQPTDPADADARDLLVQHARWYADALVELDGSVLVVRPTASAWQSGDLDDAAIRSIADSWNAVAAALPDGIRLGLHFDFLSALRGDDGLVRLLDATDASVGLALDTAEFVVAGMDPVAFYEAHADRVVHVQLKNAAAVDDDDEFRTKNAEHHVRRGGGAKPVPRWFTELETAPVLVDSKAMVAALEAHDYDGWVVVESDLSPHPATSALLNGYAVQHVLTRH